MVGTIRHTLSDYYEGELTGVIASNWGEDVMVTVDDKLSKSTTSVQTVQGPIVWSSTATSTWSGQVRFNGGVYAINVVNASTFQGLVKFQGAVQFANGTTYYVDGSGHANFNALQVNSTLTAKFSAYFQSNVYFASGTTYKVDGNADALLRNITAVGTGDFIFGTSRERVFSILTGIIK